MIWGTLGCPVTKASTGAPLLLGNPLGEVKEGGREGGLPYFTSNKQEDKFETNLAHRGEASTGVNEPGLPSTRILVLPWWSDY